jgi:uncharacterized protein (TIGR00661 family)
MNHPPEGKNPLKPRILVAPLDWGLGHASRCIPIIRELLALGSEVWLAGEGVQEVFLKNEFPDLPFLPLKGYRVRYAGSGFPLTGVILYQIPKILRAIKYENSWLKKMMKEYAFDAVISDNRYGLYHPAIPCIYITHQLAIKSSLGKWTEKILQKRNYRYISRFTQCWIPDTGGDNNLAGELSHPGKKPPIPFHYIGPLSRFELKNVQEKPGHLLAILSGPEPQRSFLENKIIDEITKYRGSATIVRGLPGSVSVIPSTPTIRFYNHLQTDELNREIQEAEYVISRSGYSTIMDLVKLQKKSILVPTPGQTEQEYLAGYLLQQHIAFCTTQKGFSVESSLQKARNLPYRFPSFDHEPDLQQMIAGFLNSLSKD